MMKEGRKLHVYRYKKGWAIKAEGNKRPTRVTKTIDDAIILAMGMSVDRNAGLKIHEARGQDNHYYSA